MFEKMFITLQVMNLISHIRRSFTAQVTLWVVGFSTVVLFVILLMMSHFLYPVVIATGDNRIEMTALLGAGVSVALLALLCWWVISHHLYPLTLLADTAQRIADGAVAEGLAVPVSGQKDEIGQLQNSFASMQHALADYVAEMEQKRYELSRHNAELQAAYAHAHESDSVKARFVGQMTEQMAVTVEAINELTNQLCDHHAELSKTELMKIQIQMLSYTETVTRLLDQMLNSSAPKSSAL